MIALLLLLASNVQAAALQADYLLINARVFRGAPEASTESVALRGNRILAVGGPADATLGDSTTVVDLQGRWLLPGFNDAHVHFMDGGLATFEVELSTATSAAEAARLVGEFARAHPEDAWVRGRGWSQTSWPGGAFPTKEDLDAVVPDRPVLLEDTDGHLAWANSLALSSAGITARTPDPAGGSILRKPGTREPAGVLIEDAASLAFSAAPAPSPQRRREALERALAEARRTGVTSVQGLLAHDEGAELDAWRELVAQGTVTVRYFMWGRLETPRELLQLKRDYSDLPADRFTFGGVKGFVDGVLGPRTAVLGKPYNDDPDARPLPQLDQTLLNRQVLAANRLGLQVELHAVGDGAVRMSLDSFEAARRTLGRARVRNKVEHIEVVDARDLPRFAALDVVASMQPSHCTYDTQSQNYNDARLGRGRLAFAWKSLEDAGAPLAFGTDWPVMPLDPRVGLFAAVTRQNYDGGPAAGWRPEQRLQLSSALTYYSFGGAYAEGRDSSLGRIAPGQVADLVVMDAGLFEAKGTALLDVPVELVFFDGRPVHAREEGPYKKDLVRD